MPEPTYVPPSDYDAIVFDLGGVILDLDFSRTVDSFTQLFARDASVLYTQMSQVPLFDRYERGETNSSEFRAQLGEFFELGRTIADAELDAAWNALLGGIPQAKLRCLTRLAQGTRLFLLSNTNEIHIERFLLDYGARHESTFGPWSGLFEQDYYSHRMGLRKPEPAIFARVLEEHGLNAGRTLFIDDNPFNVEAARALGMQARLHPSNAPIDAYFDPP